MTKTVFVCVRCNALNSPNDCRCTQCAGRLVSRPLSRPDGLDQPPAPSGLLSGGVSPLTDGYGSSAVARLPKDTG